MRSGFICAVILYRKNISTEERNYIIKDMNESLLKKDLNTYKNSIRQIFYISKINKINKINKISKYKYNSQEAYYYI